MDMGTLKGFIMNILLVNNSLVSHALLKHVAGYGSYHVHIAANNMSSKQIKNIQKWCDTYGYQTTIRCDDKEYAASDNVTVSDDDLFVGELAYRNNPLKTFSCKAIQRLASASRIEKQDTRAAYVGAMPYNPHSKH
jgi:hypothetical protein